MRVLTRVLSSPPCVNSPSTRQGASAGVSPLHRLFGAEPLTTTPRHSLLNTGSRISRLSSSTSPVLFSMPSARAKSVSNDDNTTGSVAVPSTTNCPSRLTTIPTPLKNNKRAPASSVNDEVSSSGFPSPTTIFSLTTQTTRPDSSASVSGLSATKAFSPSSARPRASTQIRADSPLTLRRADDKLPKPPQYADTGTGKTISIPMSLPTYQRSLGSP